MSYTDVEMLIAAEIAYLENSGYGTGTDMGSCSVQERLDAIRATYEMQVNAGIPIDPVLEGDMGAVNTISDILQQNNLSEDFLANWHVVDECNRNGGLGSGMYGCMIDTGDGNAIVSFRGSESEDLVTGIKDWAIADVGLLNDPLTAQQADAQMYMQELYEKYGGRYDSFCATGHSLGGNLAEHSVITAPDGMNIERCISFDGPGYSDNYMRAHREDIERNAHLIDHYQWSFVGKMLYPVPGTNYMTIDSDIPTDHGIMNLPFRHAPNNVNFDENGNVIPGHNTWFEEFMGTLSRAAEVAVSVTVSRLFPVYAAFNFLYEEGIIPALLEGAFTLIGNMENFVYACLDTITDRLESIANFVYEMGNQAASFIENLFGFGQQGEFEVSTETLSGVGSDLESIASAMDSISSEIQSLRNRIPFQSPGVSVMKGKIWRIGSNIGSVAGKCRRLGNAAVECAGIYNSDDWSAADCYY